MTATSLADIHPETQAGQASDALSRLQDLVADDLKEVNRLIVERMQSPVALIPELAGWLVAAGGKRLRPMLTLATARAWGYEGGTRHAGLAACVEFIHTATLLHDDVVDESRLRRGRPSANAQFGNKASVLVGDFLFSRAFQLMVADGSLDVLRILSQASAVIAQGEVQQLLTTGDAHVAEATYMEVIGAKTAVLFAAAAEVGALVADAGEQNVAAMREYGHELGIAFQIMDDVLDYSAVQERLGKTIGDDFREGKMTLPVLRAIQKADADEREFWHRVIGESDRQTESDLARAMEILARHDALSSAANTARAHATRAQECLADTPAGPVRDALLDVAGLVVDRCF